MSSVAVTVRSLAGDAAAVVKGAAVERNVLRLKHELVDLTGALERYDWIRMVWQFLYGYTV